MTGARAADPLEVASVARAWIGTPYHDQASLRGVGCDCLGLVRGVWREIVGREPESPPPYSRDWGETGAREVLLEAAERWLLPAVAPSVGAVVVFRMRRGALAKHCGIVVMDGRMVHAREGSGVMVEELGLAWLRRAVGVFRFPRRNA